MGFFKKDSDLFKNLSPKQAFLMGAGWGIATAVSVLLLVFMVVILGTNQGASKGLTLDNSKVDNVNTNPTPSAPTTPPPAAGDISKITPVSDSDYIRGDKNAKLTLIEYSDFQCPYCSRHVPTLDKILEEYKGEVRLVYRHFPLTSIHPNAQKAAEAAECAGDQGKFWEMHDKLFEDTKKLDDANLKSHAAGLGLNTSTFNSCLDSGKYTSKVQKQTAEGQAGGVTGTPGTFVGDQLVKGAVPYESFKAIVDSKLK